MRCKPHAQTLRTGNPHRRHRRGGAERTGHRPGPEIARTETREVESDANGAYGTSDESTDDYIVRLRAWLSRHKQYPAAARQGEIEGTVRLYIVVDQDGRIVSRRITQSSGSALLDRAAEQMLTRAEPLPRMPASMRRNRLELVVPVVFSLR